MPSPTHTEAHLVKAIEVQVGGERRKVVMHTELFLHRATGPDNVSYAITHNFYTLGSSQVSGLSGNSLASNPPHM